MALESVVVTVTMPPPTPVVVEIVAAKPGEDGAGAYQSYLDTTTDDPPLTEAEWSASRAVAALPLAGGTMDAGAAITFANGTRIIQGQMAAAPTVTDDETKGFVAGSVVMTDDGYFYDCASAAEGAAVWNLRIVDLSGYLPLSGGNLVGNLDLGNNAITNAWYVAADAFVNRANSGAPEFPFGLKAYAGSDCAIPAGGGTLALLSDVVPTDLSGHVPYAGATTDLNLTPFSLQAAYAWFGGSMVVDSNGLGDGYGFNAVNPNTRQLTATDGTTIVANWNNGGGDQGIYGVDGFGFRSNSINLNYGGLTDSMSNSVEWVSHRLINTGGIGGNYAVALDWNTRQLYDESGTPAARWGSAASGFEFVYDGFGGFYLNANGNGLTSVIPFFASGYSGGNPTNSYAATFPNGISVTGGMGSTGLDMAGYVISNAVAISNNGGLDCYLPSGGGNLLVDSETSYDIISNPNHILRASNGCIQMTALYADDLSGTMVRAPTVRIEPVAVASLATYPTEGDTSYVNDADTPVIGSAVVGGGAAKCLVCHNGTNWIVTALL